MEPWGTPDVRAVVHLPALQADEHTHTQTNMQTDLVALREVKGDPSSIFDSFTDQCISTRKQQCLLDTRRIIADHIHH